MVSSPPLRVVPISEVIPVIEAEVAFPSIKLLISISELFKPPEPLAFV